VPEPAFRKFLVRSLGTLERELPAGYRAMVQALGQRDVQVEVQREQLAICCDGTRLAIADATLKPAARARASYAALRSILEGEHSLESAVLAELLDLRGALPDLVAFYEALRSYFNAAVRCPSFAGLLSEYLNATQPE
jgi:hypothetical protein